jgi:hypothetical protein
MEVRMNNWHNEFMAEYRRQELLQEAEQIRLEKLALESGIRCPNRFERTMIAFANWMISKGKQLRKRYEAPAINCGNLPRVASQMNG